MLSEYRGQADAVRAQILLKAIHPRNHRLRRTKASPNLINRDFTSTHPNDSWLSDITYIPTRQGWLYLAAVLDAYSRALVGWAMSRTLDTKLAMDALKHGDRSIGSTGHAALRPDQHTPPEAQRNRQPLRYPTEHESQG